MIDVRDEGGQKALAEVLATRQALATDGDASAWRRLTELSSMTISKLANRPTRRIVSDSQVLLSTSAPTPRIFIR